MTITRTIANSEDIIDSRDVIERILDLIAVTEEADEGFEVDADDAEELAALRKLAEQGEDAAEDWEHGEALVRDSYFETYAQNLAEDCGMIQKGASWPNNCIDWEKAAEQLKHDYTAIDFDGVRYWIR